MREIATPGNLRSDEATHEFNSISREEAGQNRL